MPINYDAPIIIRDGRNGGWLWVDKEAWSDERLSASDKVTYGTFAYFANSKTQTLFPSISTLEQFSKTSRRQIYRSIKVLEKLKYIYVVRKHGKPNEYTLIDDAIQERKQRGAKMSLVPNNTYGGDKSALELVPNNTTNKNKEQELYNKSDVNNSYTIEIEKITTWAYQRARIKPSCSKESFKDAIAKSIALYGYDKVYNLYSDEENAISFLTNIKNL